MSATGSGRRTRLDGELRERLQLGVVGQLALDEQVPDLLERAAAGQLDGVVAAVVEEALLAAHVADRGLGDGDALEAAGREPWRRGPRRLHLLDVRDPHHVADGQDAGDTLAVHHGEVAEATLPEDLEPLLHRVRHRHRDRVLGHDLVDLGGGGVDAVADRTEEVPLADHSAQPALRIEHRCRADICAVEDHRSLARG